MGDKTTGETDLSLAEQEARQDLKDAEQRVRAIHDERIRRARFLDHTARKRERAQDHDDTVMAMALATHAWDSQPGGKPCDRCSKRHFGEGCTLHLKTEDGAALCGDPSATKELEARAGDLGCVVCMMTAGQAITQHADAIETVSEYMRGIATMGAPQPSEAIMGFMAWLTTRAAQAGPFSASDGSGQACDLVAMFCKQQGWPMPRRGWEQLILPMPQPHSD